MKRISYLMGSSMLAGALLLISPFVFGFTNERFLTFHNMVLGIVLILVSMRILFDEAMECGFFHRRTEARR